MICLRYVSFIILITFTSCSKPNIVLIMTDDQDLCLGGLTPMRHTLKLISYEGVTFKNAFVNTPVCCPSRSTLLTGRYPHNTGVTNNSVSGNCASTTFRQLFEKQSLGYLLQQNGNYRTFYAGKYLNKYGSKSAGDKSQAPLGWDSWYGLIGNSKYYDYAVSENGKIVQYKNAYFTDVIKYKADNFLQENLNKTEPVFMIVAPPAPHAPFTPAPRHRGKYATEKALRTPAFNYSSVDKHWLLRMPPNYLPSNVTRLDVIQQHRFEALLSVDELVNSIIQTLDNSHRLDNTYIIYTSDNGYHIGQFCQPWDKRQPYDTDIRIPLLIRGPGLFPKFLSNIPVQMVDLAPTILNMAKLPVPNYMDGQSLLQRLLQEQNGELVDWTTNILIEYHGEGNRNTNDDRCPWKDNDDLAECSTESWCKCQDSRNNTYNCIRRISTSEDFLFCKFSDFENFIEAYDMRFDRYQLSNIYKSMKQEDINYYNSLLNKYLKCKGKNCKNI